MTKKINEMITKEGPFQSKTEEFLQMMFSKRYNNIEDQIDAYGTESKARFYQASLVDEGLWTAPAMVASYVMLNYPLTTEIADVGSGTGTVGKIFKAGNFLQVDGYDLIPTAAEEGRPYYRNVDICNIIESPLPKQYDVITASGILTRGHVDATAAPMLAKSLKPGGELVAHHPLFDDYDYQVEAGWTKQTNFEVKYRKKFVGYIYNGKNVECELVVYKLTN
tara:strand:- start:166 stop:831 length:666 start_codon:yes stop_codon:yes gene_type:complete